MMTSLKFDSYPIRIMEIKGQPWFVAKDIADVLGYKNPHDAIRKFCKGVRDSRTPSEGGLQTIKIISEPDMYRLIIKSNLPAAEEFEKWIVEDVLPSIRKHGAYMTEQKVEDIMNDPDQMIKLLTNLKNERAKRRDVEMIVEMQANSLKISGPKVDFYDSVMNSDDVMVINGIANELGYSAVTLNRKLKQLGVIYRQGDRWLIYSKHNGMDYTRTKTYTYVGSDGKVRTNVQLVWTQKGREFIHRLIKEDTN